MHQCKKYCFMYTKVQRWHSFIMDKSLFQTLLNSINDIHPVFGGGGGSNIFIFDWFHTISFIPRGCKSDTPSPQNIHRPLHIPRIVPFAWNTCTSHLLFKGHNGLSTEQYPREWIYSYHISHIQIIINMFQLCKNVISTSPGNWHNQS